MRAFMAVRQGEEFERQGKVKPAIAKFRFAASLLDQIRASHAEWQPIVVEYRTRRTRESLERLEKKLALETLNTAPAPVRQEKPPLTEADLPPITEPVRQALPVNPQEDPLPAPDGAAAPTVETVPSRSDSKELKTLKARLDKLEQDLASTKEKLAASEKEKKNLKTQLEESSTKLEAAQSETKKAKKLADDLKEQLASAEEREKGLQSDSESKKALRREIEKLKGQLADANKAAEEKTKANDDLTAKLADAKKQLEVMSTDRDEAIKERDKAIADAKEAKDAATRMDAVVAENTALSQKLANTEKKIEELTKDGSSIPALREELMKVKEELVAARKENESYELAMADLRKELDETASELQKAKQVENPDESARLTAENQLLREIVLRELKEQARRDQAKKLVMEEVAKLEGRSHQLDEQLAILSAPVVQLSDEEKALFRKPNMQLVDDTTADAFQVVMPLEEAKASTATAQPAPNRTPLTEDALSQPVESLPGAGDQLTGQPDAGPGSPSVMTATVPNVPDALKPVALEARKQFERGDYKKAEQLYDKILASEPKNLYALSNKGVVLFRSGKMKQAEITFKKATTAKPEDSFSFSMLGIVYYQLGKFDDAIDVLTKAITIDPKNAAAHNYLGITASQKGWSEAAEEELQKAIQINPKYADAHFNLAVIYATSTPPSKELAKRHYGEAVKYGAEPDASLENLLQ